MDEYIRSIFEDNGFFTIDDGDYESMFLAAYDYTVELANHNIIDIPDLCGEFGLSFERVDSDFVAIYAK